MEKRSRYAQAQTAMCRHSLTEQKNLGVSRIAAIAAAMLTVLAMLFAPCVVPSALADDATDTPSSSAPTTADQTGADSSNIVDTENLLGSNLAKVNDAIAHTKETTGVTVRLLFLQSFNTTEQPSVWATNLLNSLDPAPNTVLLAVAANDGNLVVVVSSNSDEWLRNSKTVNKLSDAALDPIVNHDGSDSPNWAQSAIDMMNAIQTAKETASSHSMVSVGIIVAIVVVVLIIGFAIFLYGAVAP